MLEQTPLYFRCRGQDKSTLRPGTYRYESSQATCELKDVSEYKSMYDNCPGQEPRDVPGDNCCTNHYMLASSFCPVYTLISLTWHDTVP